MFNRKTCYQFLKNIVSGIFYCIYLILAVALLDVVFLHNYLGFGHQSSRTQEMSTQRQPAPYVEFTGDSRATEHNEYGFRGKWLQKAKPDELKIAFFGGSTGHRGDPPIPTVLENELERITGKKIFVANLSVEGSTHRQHLHGIIEYLPSYKPDIIVFYGGYNETMLNAMYDPRPGYPFDYYYRAQTSAVKKVLLEHSAIMGELDRRYGTLRGIKQLRNQYVQLSPSWNNQIADKYIETMELSNNITGTLESPAFGDTLFFGFYQPFVVPEALSIAHNKIRDHIKTTNYLFDVTTEYDQFQGKCYIDTVHVNQTANNVMGKKIAEIIAHSIAHKTFYSSTKSIMTNQLK